MSYLPVSIVVPVYNDPESIATTLESLLTQTTNHEIVVVDNDSTDRTPEVVRSYENDYDHLTLVHETEIQSSYAARNTGIRYTDSDLLAFVDADMTVPEDWLEAALQTFQTTDADYMGCDVELTLPENPPLPARYDYHTGFPVEVPRVPPLRPHVLSVRPTKRLRTPLSEQSPTGSTTARSRARRPAKGIYIDSTNQYVWERSTSRRMSTMR